VTSDAPPLPLGSADGATLQRWARGRRVPYRLVIRSRIVLRAAAGYSNREIARQLRVSPLTVACWLSRFRLLGLSGIRTDAPRIPSVPRVNEAKVHEVLDRTVREVPPRGGTWSTREMARATGLSHSKVRRIWHAHGLRPHQSRLSVLRSDPRYRPRAIRLAGVFVSPPREAVVVWEDPVERPDGTGPIRESSRKRPRVLRAPRRTRSDAAEQLIDLLKTVERRPPPDRSPRRMRKEFLAFLASVTDGAPAQRMHVITGPADPETLELLHRWNGRYPTVMPDCASVGPPLHLTMAEWLGLQSATARTEISPSGVDALRQAVERWSKESGERPAPFAWVMDRGRWARARRPLGFPRSNQARSSIVSAGSRVPSRCHSSLRRGVPAGSISGAPGRRANRRETAPWNLRRRAGAVGRSLSAWSS
jgi:transposase